ncbi:hypothetical protein [Motilibacter deserti]|uniref:TrbL/VirB6 plasmid conjugal transfer protein n=1 Tax=Motilibacter deserti TaxID=2714956 RepID=A0ABX0H1X7_9ACTN|nr:hypothetical protein [Motilibacter deserti]NHC15815.1 hypothetical protein [Motilibacter deserti]
MPDLCGVPGVGTICNGASNAVAAAAGSAFDAAASKVGEGFAKVLEFSLTFWTEIDAPQLSKTSGPVFELMRSTHWYTLSIAVLAITVQATRIAFTQDLRHGTEAVKGLFRWLFVVGAGVFTINALGRASDAFSVWIIDQGADGDLADRLGMITTGLNASGSGLGSGLILVLGLFGIVSSFGQMFLMMARFAVLTILGGLLPLLAASSITERGKASFDRAVAWIVAFLLYKPAAAIVYAAAFFMVGDGGSAIQVFVGLFLMVLSVLAIVPLMKLAVPAVTAATLSGAGGGAMTAVGMSVATGARMASGPGGGGGRLSASGGGGTHRPGPVTGPTGSKAAGAGGFGKAAGGFGKAAGAAAPWVVVAQGATQAAGAARRAAGSAANSVS